MLSAALREFRWPLLLGLTAGTVLAAFGSKLLRVGLNRVRTAISGAETASVAKPKARIEAGSIKRLEMLQASYQLSFTNFSETEFMQ